MRGVVILSFMAILVLAGCQKVWTPLHEGTLVQVNIAQGGIGEYSHACVQFDDDYQRLVPMCRFDTREWVIGRRYKLEINRCAGETYYRLTPSAREVL